MHLILKNSDLAAIYGVPAEDSEVEDVIKDLAARGWPEREARRHLDCAIAAGAYAYPKAEERPRAVPAKKRTQEDRP